MSTLWLPSSRVVADLVMKIEAAKYQMDRIGAELTGASERLRRIQAMIAHLEDSVEFLGSPGARIVSIREYRAMARELQILTNESNVLSNLIRHYRFGQDTLQREIAYLSRELEVETNKVLRFRKRD